MARKEQRQESTPRPEPTEYERFEDFARKVIAVPKREIDEQRDKQNGNGKKPSR